MTVDLEHPYVPISDVEQYRSGCTILIRAISSRRSALSVDRGTRAFRNTEDHHPTSDIALFGHHRMTLLARENFGIGVHLTNKAFEHGSLFVR